MYARLKSSEIRAARARLTPALRSLHLHRARPFPRVAIAIERSRSLSVRLLVRARVPGARADAVHSRRARTFLVSSLRKR